MVARGRGGEGSDKWLLAVKTRALLCTNWRKCFSVLISNGLDVAAPNQSLGKLRHVPKAEQASFAHASAPHLAETARKCL